MLDILAENLLVLLFAVIGLGYLIGNINIFGFKLGVAAVLFVGIALGAIDDRLALPEYITIIGLVLFVYAVGLQSGPGFFASFRKRGMRYSLMAALILAAGALTALLVGKIFGLSAPSTAGLFCGALTNTPALAAAVEAAQNLSGNLPDSVRQYYVNAPVVTYGLAYPFGVFGVILMFFICGKICKADASSEARNIETSDAPSILSRTFRVTNPAVTNKSIEDTMKYAGETGFVLSRIKKRDKIDVVMPNTLLESGDLIIAVGNNAAMERARLLFGEVSPERIPDVMEQISYRRVFVSNKALVGKSIREIQLHKQLHATITRLRRGDVDFVPSPETPLELGDRIKVVAPSDEMEQVVKLFGDSVKSISETDYLSLSLGIVLGVFLGMIPIPLGGGLTFKLGFAGGPLIAGLILGKLERTGPINWEMPFNANLVLRQVGLVFFLASIGTKAGGALGDVIHVGGIGLFVGGAIITLVVTMSAILLGYKYLKLPMVAVMGMMAGIQTQPACLAYANQQTDSELPNVWYTTVYPASMVSKIILAQLIVSTIILL